jgi:hypothetical protein
MSKYILILIGMAFIVKAPCVYGFTSSIESYNQPYDKKSQKWDEDNCAKERFCVLNIVIDKMDSSTLYTRDGRKFSITSTTRMINEHNSDGNLRTGQLFFRNGNLVTIVIK